MARYKIIKEFIIDIPYGFGDYFYIIEGDNGNFINTGIKLREAIKAKQRLIQQDKEKK